MSIVLPSAFKLNNKQETDPVDRKTATVGLNENMDYQQHGLISGIMMTKFPCTCDFNHYGRDFERIVD